MIAKKAIKISHSELTMPEAQSAGIINCIQLPVMLQYVEKNGMNLC